MPAKKGKKSKAKKGSIPKRQALTAGSEHQIAAIFVDVEDSTGIANYLEPEGYRQFLTDFHDVVKKVLDEPKWKGIKEKTHHKFFGDEFVAFLPNFLFKDPVDEALDLAYKLKLRWYISDRNTKRLETDKEPIELNVGINSGIVSVMDYPVLSGNHTEVTYEGYPITLAKRVQTVGEEGRASRIMLADKAFRDYAKKRGEYEFSYFGRSQLKGLSQNISCYEWLGKEFDLLSYDPSLIDDKKIFDNLEKLQAKDPLNPWYATLLATVYYAKAEDLYSQGKTENEFYIKTAEVCLKAIENISWTKLRTLSTMLLTCLEVRQDWELLGYRAEQAFNKDPSFADALAFRARALLGQAGVTKTRDGNDERKKEAEKEARRLITLFGAAPVKENEAMFHANFVLAAIYALDENLQAFQKLKDAAKYAKEENLWWAADDLEDGKETLFKKISSENQWTEIVRKFKEMKR